MAEKSDQKLVNDEKDSRYHSCYLKDISLNGCVGQLSSQKNIFNANSFSKLEAGWPIWAKSI